ncbi:hypothetical protein EG68_01207 [Paragonimus skrjabini miyazakii]|uniref:Uncharacterized protein n=1 Tax=Paragonimus skrjabini miyazakii TaxID=59628 RepID=A0A8S9ZA44_9TREM|nr:hypothetical protein EG68_01207 [Paragonimus skrjabini miyazakii]
MLWNKSTQIPETLKVVSSTFVGNVKLFCANSVTDEFPDTASLLHKQIKEKTDHWTWLFHWAKCCHA